MTNASESVNTALFLTDIRKLAPCSPPNMTQSGVWKARCCTSSPVRIKDFKQWIGCHTHQFLLEQSRHRLAGSWHPFSSSYPDTFF